MPSFETMLASLEQGAETAANSSQNIDTILPGAGARAAMPFTLTVSRQLKRLSIEEDGSDSWTRRSKATEYGSVLQR